MIAKRSDPSASPCPDDSLNCGSSRMQSQDVLLDSLCGARSPRSYICFAPLVCPGVNAKTYSLGSFPTTIL